MSGSKIDFSKELYVHNVSFSTTAETVRKYFSQYGPVFECRKVRDHNQCEGSALLTFVHAADAARALKRRRHFIDNRAVEVWLASTDPRHDDYSSVSAPQQEGVPGSGEPHSTTARDTGADAVDTNSTSTEQETAVDLSMPAPPLFPDSQYKRKSAESTQAKQRQPLKASAAIDFVPSYYYYSQPTAYIVQQAPAPVPIYTAEEYAYYQQLGYVAVVPPAESAPAPALRPPYLSSTAISASVSSSKYAKATPAVQSETCSASTVSADESRLSQSTEGN